MRGVVTLYTRQLQFLFEDCATVLAHLTTISSEEYRGRRGCHLLISRRKQPKALSRRVDFNHLELEEDIIHIQSGEECMRSDLNAFVVMDTFSDHELSPRGSLLYSGELEGEDHVCEQDGSGNEHGTDPLRAEDSKQKEHSERPQGNRGGHSGGPSNRARGLWFGRGRSKRRWDVVFAHQRLLAQIDQLERESRENEKNPNI